MNSSYTFSDTDNVSVGTDGIDITKDVTIDGKGYTLDASNKASIFKIANNAHVILKNIVFSNGNATNGGAINVDHGSELRITKSEFSGNTSVDSGGAINNWGFSTIIHSRLYENKAGCGGGAICNCPGGQLNVSASVINNNTASEKYGGGAVYNNRGACTLTECDINYNEPNNVFEN